MYIYIICLGYLFILADCCDNVYAIISLWSISYCLYRSNISLRISRNTYFLYCPFCDYFIVFITFTKWTYFHKIRKRLPHLFLFFLSPSIYKPIYLSTKLTSLSFHHLHTHTRRMYIRLIWTHTHAYTHACLRVLLSFIDGIEFSCSSIV